MKIISGIVTLLTGIFLFFYGINIEKGLAFSFIGLILVYTGYEF